MKSVEWALGAIKDGLPIRWAAESTQEGEHELRRLAREAGIETTDDWMKTWPAIRKSPTLLDLHRQIAPQGSQGRGGQMSAD